MVNRFLAVICCAATTLLFAQQPSPSAAQTDQAKAIVGLPFEQPLPDGGVPEYIRPETPEQRQARVGSHEDPGFDPDPTKVWVRYGLEYQIHKYERRWTNTDGAPEGWIRPFGFANIFAEIYQRNNKYVWVWWPMEKPMPPEPTPEQQGLSKETIDYIVALLPDYKPLPVEDSGVTVRFTESSAGLPQSGSWRNVLDVADANGDGFLDIIAPPERKGNATPAIFLGDGKGQWKAWQTIFPYGIDYGAVAAADFNKDGHMDLVAAVHLVGLRAFLGDGKGNFKDASDGLPSDYPTRRVTVADVDRDGDLDIVAIHEGPTALGMDVPRGRIVAYLNTAGGTKWEPLDVAQPGKVFGGDYLAVGHFNADRYPDFVGSSVYMNASDIVYLSDGKNSWENVGGSGRLLPFFSYYYGVTPGKFASKKRDDVAVSFVRTWPGIDKRFVGEPELKKVVGVDLIEFEKGGPRRRPVIRWESEVPLRGLASGDFDGDGNLDLIYTPMEPRGVEILLGNGKGEFKRAKVEGLTMAPNDNYDIKVADVNRDKRADVILMYESEDTKNAFAPRDGKIQVFLGQPAATATASKKAAAK